jgi:hypothetical protein
MIKTVANQMIKSITKEFVSNVSGAFILTKQTIALLYRNFAFLLNLMEPAHNVSKDINSTAITNVLSKLLSACENSDQSKY